MDFVLISLARVMLFRVMADVLDASNHESSLNLSCESNAFQGIKIASMLQAELKVLISLARVMLFRSTPLDAA